MARLGKRVHEAVAEIQSGGVSASPKAIERVARDTHLLFIEINYFGADSRYERIDVINGVGAVQRLQDDTGLQKCRG